MRKFLVEIQFNGKNYSGFQHVGNGVAIADKITEALEKLFGQAIEINGCSRTDAGVSAESYFFDFKASTKLPTDRIPYKLNRFLPKDIQAVSAKEVGENFHARFSTKSKTYEYGFYLSEHKLPLLNPKFYRLKPTVNVSDMLSACQLFKGKHDFTSFKTSTKEETSCVRTIFDCDLVTDGKKLIFKVRGDGFLYNMVRILAGTLVKVGNGEMTVNQVEHLLNDNLSRSSNPALTLPPNALLLKSVEY